MPKLGHEAPHLDYAAEPKSDQLKLGIEQAIEPLTTQTEEVVPEAEATEVKVGQVDSRIPSPAKERLEIELEEAGAEWDRRSKNHPMTSQQIRQDIGGAMLTGSDVEDLEKPKSKGGKRPQKDRRHLSSGQKMAADDTVHSVREKAGSKGPATGLTEEEKEIGRRAIEVARRDLGFDK